MSDGQQRSLIDKVRDAVQADSLCLPVCEKVALKVYRMVRKDDTSADQLISTLSSDPSLSSRILANANSAYFAGLQPASTLKDAIVRLGQKKVANIAVLAGQENLYKSAKKEIAARLAKCWCHAVTVAFGAQWLAMNTGYRRIADEAFLAGLFHDIGRLAILSAVDTLTSTSSDLAEIPGPVLEELMDSLHMKVGADVLTRESLPELYIMVARDHEATEMVHDEPIFAMVRIADRACKLNGLCGHLVDDSIDLVACPESAMLDLSEIQLAEFQVDLEDHSVRASA